MKSFRDLIAEVAQPKAEDEINFKEKHIIDHSIDPEAEEDQFTADTIKKFKNKADYAVGDDIAVYEGTVCLSRDIPGQEDDDVDNDNDQDIVDSRLRHRRHAEIKNKIIDEDATDLSEISIDLKRRYNESTNVGITKKNYSWGKMLTVHHGKSHSYPLHPEHQEAIKELDNGSSTSFKDETGARITAKRINDVIVLKHSKINEPTEISRAHFIDESMDPVGREDSDIDNDGKITKSDAYLHARRRAIARKLKQEGLEPVTPAGGEYDSEKTHSAYKKSNKKQNASQFETRTGLRIYAGDTKRSQIGESQTLFVEAYSQGILKLKDGSSVKLSKQDADLLNTMFNDLNSTNRKRMQGVLIADKNGFDEIIGFAREAL